MRNQNDYKADTEHQWIGRDALGKTRVIPSLPSRDRRDGGVIAHLFPATARMPARPAGELLLHLTGVCATVDIILLPGFDAHNLAALVDVFSAANRVDSRRRYAYRLIGLRGTSTASSSGFEVHSGGTLGGIAGRANVAVIGSCLPTTEDFPQLSNFLRYQSRIGSKLIGIASGAAVLAAAGVTRRRKVAATWRARQIWREIYPETEFSDCIFAVDDTLITTPGGRATIHLAMAIVKKMSGEDVARKVADVLNLSSVRDAAELQTFLANHANSARKDILSRALEEMFNNLEQPISTDDLSRHLKISTRQLQRLFKARLNTNPRSYYVACRLDYARDLIQLAGMSVTEAAVAAGFVSLSHFSKCYRRRFGIHPRNDR